MPHISGINNKETAGTFSICMKAVLAITASSGRRLSAVPKARINPESLRVPPQHSAGTGRGEPDSGHEPPEIRGMPTADGTETDDQGPHSLPDAPAAVHDDVLAGHVT